MFKKLLCRWQKAYRIKAANRRTYHQLNVLDDRTLKDIGLCRSDLLALRYAESLSKESNGPEPCPLEEYSARFQRLQAIGECNV